VITFHAGRVTIVDRAGLESFACECYKVIKTALDGVVDRALHRGRSRTSRIPME